MIRFSPSSPLPKDALSNWRRLSRLFASHHFFPWFFLLHLPSKKCLQNCEQWMEVLKFSFWEWVWLATLGESKPHYIISTCIDFVGLLKIKIWLSKLKRTTLIKNLLKKLIFHVILDIPLSLRITIILTSLDFWTFTSSGFLWMFSNHLNLFSCWFTFFVMESSHPEFCRTNHQQFLGRNHF